MAYIRRLGRAGALFLSAALAAGAPAATVGKPAPKFTLTTFDREKVKLEDIRGKVVVLNYWATWCAPCKAEMPMMNAFHRENKDRGFEIYAVTTEDSVPKHQLKKLKSLLSFPLADSLRSDGYGMIRGAVPTSYIIDRNGIVRHAKAGAFQRAEFEALILPLLAEPAP